VRSIIPELKKMDRKAYALTVIIAASVALLTIAMMTGCIEYNVPNPESKCSPKTPKPISVNRVINELRERGYQEVEKKPDGCMSPDTVMELNARPRGDARGLVICDIRVRPIYGRGFRRLTSRTWVQDNTQCGVYPGSKEKASAEYAWLRDTVRFLAP
jgi:hypothetical protein